MPFCFVILASYAEPSSCGTAYPPDFPCLDGGVAEQAPSLPFPDLQRLSLVVYEGTAADLSANLTKAAQAEGWQVDVQPAAEPEGTRYRMEIAREDRSRIATAPSQSSSKPPWQKPISRRLRWPLFEQREGQRRCGSGGSLVALFAADYPLTILAVVYGCKRPRAAESWRSSSAGGGVFESTILRARI
jgi:hypothetical protein